MTTYTNVYGIEEAIAQAVRTDSYRLVGDISVTGLIRPPQVAHLEHKHKDEIVEDVSDGLWRLLGQAVHEILAQAEVDNALQEEQLTMEVEGWIVSGRPDLWAEPAILKDYKVTSVWTFLLGDKPDWQAQLNFYAVLYRHHGFLVEQQSIAAILRDWQKSRRGDDYPPIPFMEVDVPVWPPAVAEERLAERVRLHQAARGGVYDPCTPAERWARPDAWAVMKKGNVRATKVCDTEEEATAIAEVKGAAYEVGYRRGKSVRCEDYCPVAQWCDQWATLRDEGGNEND